MLIVNIAGVLLIALIVWWFWLYKPPETRLSDDKITVIVDKGTYDPSHIRIPSGQASGITFLRKDPSPCAELVVFPDLDISKQLPVDQEQTVHLPPLDPGKYAFIARCKCTRALSTLNKLQTDTLML